jgi:farnesyl diphosphate synthase
MTTQTDILADTAFAPALARAAERTEAVLDSLLPPAGDDGQGRIAEAMRHATLGGGKRLRAFLTVESAALFDVPETGALRVAAAVECLHAYSLVHDDLPCMDDDALRRGQPTVHVKWDEATAVLAGDALQTLAFEILAAPETHPDGATRAALVTALARASGAAGMVGGQALDLAAETAAAPLDLAAITRLQALKTGALIVCAVELGAILGGAEPARAAALKAFAADLGLAFQIRDDLLDIEGDAAAIGKRAGKDEAAGKATFATLLGVEGARAKAAALTQTAEKHLAPFGPRAAVLAGAARYTIQRGN